MDSGEVVWLPGAGYSGGQEDLACQDAYGNYYACGAEYDPSTGGTWVACCPYGG